MEAQSFCPTSVSVPNDSAQEASHSQEKEDPSLQHSPKLSNTGAPVNISAGSSSMLSSAVKSDPASNDDSQQTSLAASVVPMNTHNEFSRSVVPVSPQRKRVLTPVVVCGSPCLLPQATATSSATSVLSPATAVGSSPRHDATGLPFRTSHRRMSGSSLPSGNFKAMVHGEPSSVMLYRPCIGTTSEYEDQNLLASMIDRDTTSGNLNVPGNNVNKRVSCGSPTSFASPCASFSGANGKQDVDTAGAASPASSHRHSLTESPTCTAVTRMVPSSPARTALGSPSLADNGLAVPVSESEKLTGLNRYVLHELKAPRPQASEIEAIACPAAVEPFRKAWWAGVRPATCERTCRHRSKVCDAIQLCNDCTGYYCKWLADLVGIPVLKASGRVDPLVFHTDPLAKLYWDRISKVVCCPKSMNKCLMCIRRYQLFTHFLPGNLLFRGLVHQSVMKLNEEGFAVDMGLIRKVTRLHLERIAETMELRLPAEYFASLQAYEIILRRGPLVDVIASGLTSALVVTSAAAAAAGSGKPSKNAAKGVMSYGPVDGGVVGSDAALFSGSSNNNLKTSAPRIGLACTSPHLPQRYNSGSSESRDEHNNAGTATSCVQHLPVVVSPLPSTTKQDVDVFCSAKNSNVSALDVQISNCHVSRNSRGPQRQLRSLRSTTGARQTEGNEDTVNGGGAAQERQHTECSAKAASGSCDTEMDGSIVAMLSRRIGSALGNDGKDYEVFESREEHDLGANTCDFGTKRRRRGQRRVSGSTVRTSEPCGSVEECDTAEAAIFSTVAKALSEVRQADKINDNYGSVSKDDADKKEPESGCYTHEDNNDGYRQTTGPRGMGSPASIGDCRKRNKPTRSGVASASSDQVKRRLRLRHTLRRPLFKGDGAIYYGDFEGDAHFLSMLDDDSKQEEMLKQKIADTQDDSMCGEPCESVDDNESDELRSSEERGSGNHVNGRKRKRRTTTRKAKHERTDSVSGDRRLGEDSLCGGSLTQDLRFPGYGFETQLSRSSLRARDLNALASNFTELAHQFPSIVAAPPSDAPPARMRRSLGSRRRQEEERCNAEGRTDSVTESHLTASLDDARSKSACPRQTQYGTQGCDDAIEKKCPGAFNDTLHAEQLEEETRLADAGVRGVFWDPAKEAWCALLFLPLSPAHNSSRQSFQYGLIRRKILCFHVRWGSVISAKWNAVYERLRSNPAELKHVADDVRQELAGWVKANVDIRDESATVRPCGVETHSDGVREKDGHCATHFCSPPSTIKDTVTTNGTVEDANSKGKPVKSLMFSEEPTWIASETHALLQRCGLPLPVLETVKRSVGLPCSSSPTSLMLKGRPLRMSDDSKGESSPACWEPSCAASPTIMWGRSTLANGCSTDALTLWKNKSASDEQEQQLASQSKSREAMALSDTPRVVANEDGRNTCTISAKQNSCSESHEASTHLFKSEEISYATSAPRCGSEIASPPSARGFDDSANSTGWSRECTTGVCAEESPTRLADLLGSLAKALGTPGEHVDHGVKETLVRHHDECSAGIFTRSGTSETHEGREACYCSTTTALAATAWRDGRRTSSTSTASSTTSCNAVAAAPDTVRSGCHGRSPIVASPPFIPLKEEQKECKQSCDGGLTVESSVSTAGCSTTTPSCGDEEDIISAKECMNFDARKGLATENSMAGEGHSAEPVSSVFYSTNVHSGSAGTKEVKPLQQPISQPSQGVIATPALSGVADLLVTLHSRLMEHRQGAHPSTHPQSASSAKTDAACNAEQNSSELHGDATQEIMSNNTTAHLDCSLPFVSPAFFHGLLEASSCPTD